MDDPQQGVTTSLVQGSLRGDLLQLRIDGGLGPGVRVGGQLGADGAVGVVEAHAATLVCRSREEEEKGCGSEANDSGQATSASWRAEHSLAWSHSARSVSTATSAWHPLLSSEGDLAGVQRAHGWGRSQPVTATWVVTVSSPRDAVALTGQDSAPNSPLHLVLLATVDPLRRRWPHGRPSSLGLVEEASALLGRHGRDRTDQLSTATTSSQSRRHRGRTVRPRGADVRSLGPIGPATG